MTAKLLVSVGLMVFGALLPVLEISDTHVFNPDWPPHARLHEVWQLITHSSLALIALWLVWARGAIPLAGAIGIAVMGGVLAAHALSGTYGGALTYPGGPETTVLGLHVTVLVPLLAIALFSAAIAIRPKA